MYYHPKSTEEQASVDIDSFENCMQPPCCTIEGSGLCDWKIANATIDFEHASKHH
jgi:hypothetical protein